MERIFIPQRFSLLHLASSKKVLVPTANSENAQDDSFDYIPPKVPATYLSLKCNFISLFFNTNSQLFCSFDTCLLSNAD